MNPYPVGRDRQDLHGDQDPFDHLTSLDQRDEPQGAAALATLGLDGEGVEEDPTVDRKATHEKAGKVMLDFFAEHVK